ncbi:MAG: hypothetical protein Kow0099_33490 [Candidatus Abyssubacteria bacterium]
MKSPDLDNLLERLRKAGHGTVIKLGMMNSGAPVEGIIIEPGAHRPPGYESGVFVAVPSEPDRLYYLDPHASKEQGKLVFQVIELKAPHAEPRENNPEEHLKQFECLWNAPDVKRGGGATGEKYSKHKGVVDVD